MTATAGKSGHTFVVGNLAEAFACSQRAAEFARAAGFDQSGTWEITIAVSELATNLVAHAGGGHIGIAVVPGCGIQLVSSDSGPGIVDVPSAITDDFSRGQRLSEEVPHGLRVSLGSGLGAVKRLTDDLEITPRADGGTLVSAFKSLPGGPRASASPEQVPVPERATTVLLGLGNAILSDDGVGIKVVRRIAEQTVPAGVDIKEAELAGFALLDLLEGYERAVVVDAVRLQDAAAGDVVVFDAESLAPSLHLVAGHQIDLPSALELGRRLGISVPSSVHVVGIQICDDTTFSEECTPAVTAAIPEAVAVTLRILADDDRGDTLGEVRYR